MNCLYCGKQLDKGQTKYCCVEHQKEFEYKQHIEKWKSGEDEGYSGTGIKKFIRKYLFDKFNNKCQLCGWGEENPYTHNIPLEVHHKDGNYKNNKEDNLQLLCPNCHSLTDNYKSMNKDSRRDSRNKYINRKIHQRNYCVDCGKQIGLESTRCTQCSNIKKNHKEIPVSRDDLKKMITATSFTQIGIAFGVTDSTIRKWCKRYGLPFKKHDIDKITDNEWESV